LFLTAISNGISFQGLQMSIIARIDQSIKFAPGFLDAGGNAVTELGGVPQWNVSDANIATLEVAEDGMSATLTPTGVLGTVQVSLVVDADPDADVEEINATAEVTFKAGKAVFVTLSSQVSDKVVAAPAPTPEPQPEPAPETPAEPAPVDPVAETPVDTGAGDGAAPADEQPAA
jgi:hypothetical protein